MRSRLFTAILSFSVVIAFVAFVQGQRSPINPGGTFRSYEFLLVNESVQKELKLSDEQLVQVNGAVHGIRQKRRAELEKLRDLPAPKGREKFLRILEANSEEALNNSSNVLKPEQVKRLKQIKVQQDGFDAFYAEGVVTALKLTKAQQEQVKKIDRETSQKAEKTPQVGSGGNFPTTLSTMEASRKALLQQAIDLLTAEQKAVWKDLVGEPFNAVPRPRNAQKKSEEGKKSQ